MKKYLLILLVLSGLLFFFNLGVRPLLSSGEARASEIALEMMKTGNFLVPYLNEKIILTKPPLFHWLIILCYKLFGVSEFSSRIISSLAGVLVVVFTYLLGKKLWNKQTGFIAGVILLTSPLFFWSARCARIDSLLLFFITISIYCFWRGYEELPNGGAIKNVHNNTTSAAAFVADKRWFLGWFVFMGFGALAKGPIAIAAPMGTAILFLLFIGKRYLIRKLPWIWGLLLLFFIITPWFVSISFFVPAQHAEKFFVKQNEAWFGGHGELLRGYVYIFNLFFGFFPWSLAFPSVLAVTWKDFWHKKDEKKIFLWIWFLLVFCIFFFFGKKVSRYILPMYPAFALLIAYTLSVRKNMNNVFSYVLVYFWLFILVAVNFFVLYSRFISPELIPIIIKYMNKFWLNIIGSFMIIAGVYGIKKKSLIVPVSMVFVSLIVFILYVIPVERDYYSPKPFCEMLKEEIQENAEMRAYKSWDNTIRYYFGRHVDVMEEEKELVEFLKSPEKVYCIMWENVYKKLPVKIERQVYLVKEGYRVIDRKMVLVANK